MMERLSEIASHEGEAADEMKRIGFAVNTGASASAVNRTHRVVRERAKTLQEQKKHARSLWIPLTVSFGMLALILIALWNLLEDSELFADGIPDASQQMMMISMWCLPLSVIVLAVIWFRRTRAGDRSPR